jgi:hypothetical protein
MLSIVQFTHPGGEHKPDKKNGNHKSWNTGAHRRKFMICQGKYVDNNKLSNGKLMFWGEWEPPSRVERLDNQPDSFFPEWLHTPYLPQSLPNSDGYQKSFQNTDPFVFGDCFKYFVCKQFKQKNRKATKLAKLEKGSVILFGATHGKTKENAFFQLDTVFVVSDYIEYDISDPNALDIERIGNYRNVVYKMAFPKPLNYSLKLRLYFGATYEKPFEGMYSFAPSKVWENNNQGFPRVQLKDTDHLTNNLNTAPRITEPSIETVKAFWQKIKAFSKEQGCVEGVKFKYEEE